MTDQMTIRLSLLLLVASLLSASPVFSQQCVSTNTGAPAIGTSARLNFLNQAAQNISGRIMSGASQWNGQNNQTAPDWPWFSTSSQADITVNVVVHQGPTSIPSGRSSSPCGQFGGDGEGGTMILYEQWTNGTTNFSCRTDSTSVVSDRVAHELGHFLGLNDTPSGQSSCNCHMMGPAQWQNGTFSGCRQIQSQEKSAVDDKNETMEETIEECTECPSPILVDLDRNGFHLTGLADPVLFDINADGALDLISWTSAARMDGFLALDRNDNGLIDDGGELFGNHTLLSTGEKAPNGYVALAEFDMQNQGGNADEEIDWRDSIFAQLMIWLDLDHDGISQVDELFALEEVGLVRLKLRYSETRRMDEFGNWFRYSSKAWVEGPGNSELPVKTSDVYFRSGVE